MDFLIGDSSSRNSPASTGGFGKTCLVLTTSGGGLEAINCSFVASQKLASGLDQSRDRDRIELELGCKDEAKCRKSLSEF